MTYTDRRPAYLREQDPTGPLRITPYGTGEFAILPGDRLALTGSVGEVAQMLAQVQAAGRFVSSTAPVPTGIPGQVLINVRMSPEPIQRTYTVEQRRGAPVRQPMPRWAFWGLIAGGVAVLGGLAWGVVVAVNAIAANPAPVVAVVVLAVVAVGFIGGAGAKASGGKTFSGTFRGKIR